MPATGTRPEDTISTTMLCKCEKRAKAVSRAPHERKFPNSRAGRRAAQGSQNSPDPSIPGVDKSTKSQLKRAHKLQATPLAGESRFSRRKLLCALQQAPSRQRACCRHLFVQVVHRRTRRRAEGSLRRLRGRCPSTAAPDEVAAPTTLRCDFGDSWPRAQRRSTKETVCPRQK